MIGHSDPDEHGEGGLSKASEQNLTGRAIRRRWSLGPAAKRKAIEATISNLKDGDGRVINGAVRNLLLMESQNMEQEQLDNPPASAAAAAPSVEVNILNSNTNTNAIQIVETDDWYGTRAAVESKAAAPIYLNGNGSNGHANGSGNGHTNGSNGHAHTNGNGKNGHAKNGHAAAGDEPPA